MKTMSLSDLRTVAANRICVICDKMHRENELVPARITLEHKNGVSFLCVGLVCSREKKGRWVERGVGAKGARVKAIRRIRKMKLVLHDDGKNTPFHMEVKTK